MSPAQSFGENIVAISTTILLILFIFPIKISHSDTDFFALTNCSVTEETNAPNSTFQRNLKFVLSNLTFAATSANLSFYNFSSGQNKDKVYGLYLCRGDLTTEDCSYCILNITHSITDDCPNNTESISWDSKCMIRYAKRNIFSKAEEIPHTLGLLAPAEAAISNGTFLPPPPVLPTFNRTKVLYNLINETAFGHYLSPGTARFYAAREDNITGNSMPEVFYSLSQCTPDISPQECHKCLSQAPNFLSCCPDVLQGYFYFPSCQIKIDVVPFFRAKNNTNLSFPPPSNNSGSTTGIPPTGEVDHKKKAPSYIPIAVAVPSAMVALLLAGVCFFMWRRNRKSSSNDENQIITMESLQYDMSTIKAATNNFSAENKVGQGGFGFVYKGRLQSGGDIAVKRLSTNSKQGTQELKTELLLVANLQHKNVVRLLGFCVTEEEKLLVYEYLPHSSLERLLSGNEIMEYKGTFGICGPSIRQKLFVGRGNTMHPYWVIMHPRRRRQET